MLQKIFAKTVRLNVIVVILSLIAFSSTPVQAQTANSTGTILGRGAINDIAWSADDNQIAIATTVGVWLYNAAQITDEPQLIQTNFEMRAVAFSPDSKTLVYGGGDNLVNVWDIASKQNTDSYKGHQGSVYGLAFSPDGKSIASASSDETVKIWDAATGDILQTLKGHTDFVQGVAFSPDGKSVASASDDGTVKLWTVATGKELRTLKQPDNGTSYLVSVAFSPDGKTVLAGGHTKSAFFWTAATGKLIKATDTGLYDIYRVGFSRDGKVAVAAGSDDFAIHLLNPTTGADTGTLTGHKGDVKAFAFSPDGKLLISGDVAGSLRLWDMSTTKVKTVIDGQFGNDYQASALSPDSTLIAVSYYWDNLIRLWKTDGSSKVPVVLKGHTYTVYSLAFSNDNTILASGSSDDTIMLWNVSTGKSTLTLKDQPGTTYSLAFNANGSLLASGTAEGIVTLWNVSSGKEVATFKGHTSKILSVKFTSDDKHIISVSDDGTVRIWEMPTT